MTTCISECLLCLYTDKVETGFNWFGPVISKIAELLCKSMLIITDTS